jgi:hypothetical protein
MEIVYKCHTVYIESFNQHLGFLSEGWGWKWLENQFMESALYRLKS